MASTYGWSHREILSLKARQFLIYLREVDAIEARWFFLSADAASYPYMKSTDRIALARKYNSILNPPKLISDSVEVDKSWDALREAKDGNRST